MADRVILVFHNTRLPITCDRFLLVDARPLFLHLQPGSMVRLVATAGNEAVDKVGREVRADKPQPPQGCKPKGDKEGGPKDNAGNADPEQREYDGGEEGEGDGAQHEGGEEEDGDE